MNKSFVSKMAPHGKCLSVSLLLLATLVLQSNGDRINHAKSACQKKIFDACIKSKCNCTMTHHHVTNVDLHEKITWSALSMHCDSVTNLEDFAAADKCMIFEPEHGLDEYGETQEYWGKLPLEVDEVIAEQKNARLGVYDPDSDIQRRSFLQFTLKLNDKRVRNIRTGSCVNTKDYHCLRTGGRKDLNWVTRLEITGKRLRSFGTSREPVLQLFPNLQVLVLSPRKMEFKMALVELSALQELHVNARHGVVKLYCAFNGDNCLNNPDGLHRLELNFAEARYSKNNPQQVSRISGFELYGKLRLPKVIGELVIKGKNGGSRNHKRSEIFDVIEDSDDLDVDVMHENQVTKNTGYEAATARNAIFVSGEETGTEVVKKTGHESFPIRSTAKRFGSRRNEVGNRQNTSDDNDGDDEDERKVEGGMFKLTEFENVVISYRIYRFGQLTLDEFKLPRVKGRFEISLSRADLDTVLPKLYEMEVEDQLVVNVDEWDGRPYNAPYLDLKRPRSVAADFSGCEYGKSMFKYLRVETKKRDSKLMIIVRGFAMRLSEIVEAAKSADLFANVKLVTAFVYDLDVDIELNGDKGEALIPGKKLKLYYARVGTTSDSIPLGLKQARISKKTFGMASFATGFYHIRDAKQPDAVFMRALATCLIVRIGELGKAAHGKPLKEDNHLSSWLSVIQQTRSFDRTTFTDLEIARTESAFKLLQQYVTWHDHLNTAVTIVPLMRLQSESLQILGETGRELLSKKMRLEALPTVETINNQGKASLKDSMRKISDSKISILQLSQTKTEALANVELKHQKDLMKELESSQETVSHFSRQFDEFSAEVEQETMSFLAGSDFAGGMAEGQTTVEAVSMVTSVFTGNFNPVIALRTSKDMNGFTKEVEKLAVVTEKIASLVKYRKLLNNDFKKIKFSYKSLKTSVAAFFKRQKSLLREWTRNKQLNTAVGDEQAKEIEDLKSLSDQVKTTWSFLESTQDMVANTLRFIKVRRSVDPATSTFFVDHNPLAGVNDTIREFQIKKAKGVSIDYNEGLSAINVFKWSIVKDYISDMVETTLSGDVPEATNYRASLMRLLQACEMRMQASLDQAMMEINFAASKSSWDTYFEEAVAVGEAIIETEDGLNKIVEKYSGDKKAGNEATTKQLKIIAIKKRMDVELDFLWETAAVKFELVRLNREYCDAYYYHHLERCGADLRVDPSESLEEILAMQNMLLYQGQQRLTDFSSPPQTFTDRTITIKSVEHCDCLKEIQELRVKESQHASNRLVLLDATYERTKECLMNDGFYFASDDASAGSRKRKEHHLINELLLKCVNNPVKDLQENQEFVYKVGIDHPLFRFHERVRLDEVKVILKGAKTDNGVLEVSIQNTGVLEDKYDGRCYKFVGGDKWRKGVSYYSKHLEGELALGVSRERRSVSDDEFRALVSSLDGIKTKINERSEQNAVFIDSADIHHSFTGVSQSPSVFATWIIKVPKNRNQGLELSDLKEIELKFSGSFVRTIDGAASMKCKLKDESEIVLPLEPDEDEDVMDNTDGITIFNPSTTLPTTLSTEATTPSTTLEATTTFFTTATTRSRLTTITTTTTTTKNIPETTTPTPTTTTSTTTTPPPTLTPAVATTVPKPTTQFPSPQQRTPSPEENEMVEEIDPTTSTTTKTTTPKPAMQESIQTERSTPSPLIAEKGAEDEPQKITPAPLQQAPPNGGPTSKVSKAVKITKSNNKHNSKNEKSQNLKGLRMSNKKLDTSKSQNADDERKFNQAAFGTKTTAKPPTTTSTTTTTPPTTTTTTTSTTTTTTTTTTKAPKRKIKLQQKKIQQKKIQQKKLQQKKIQQKKVQQKKVQPKKVQPKKVQQQQEQLQQQQQQQLNVPQPLTPGQDKGGLPQQNSIQNNNNNNKKEQNRSKKQKNRKQLKKKKQKFPTDISHLYGDGNVNNNNNNNNINNNKNNNNNNANNNNSNNNNNVNTNVNNNNVNNKLRTSPHQQHYEEYSSSDWPIQETSQNNHQEEQQQLKKKMNKQQQQQQQQQQFNSTTNGKQQNNTSKPSVADMNKDNNQKMLTQQNITNKNNNNVNNQNMKMPMTQHNISNNIQNILTQRNINNNNSQNMVTQHNINNGNNQAVLTQRNTTTTEAMFRTGSKQIKLLPFNETLPFALINNGTNSAPVSNKEEEVDSD